AIAEAAAVAEPVALDDGAGMVHKRMGQAPAALVEIACGASIMPGVRDVTAMCQAADMPWFVAMRDEIRDQLLEARRKMARNRDRPRGGGDGHDTAAMPHASAGGVPAAMPRVSCLPRPLSPVAMGRTPHGVVTVSMVMSKVAKATMPV